MQRQISVRAPVSNFEKFNKSVPQPSPTEETQTPITLAFGGDVMLDRSIRQAAEKRGYDFLFTDIKPVLSEADFTLVDLEGPVTTNTSVSVGSKVGSAPNYVFTFDPASLKAVKDSGVDLVSIGNNHILNQGINGLEQTRSFLKENSLPFIGDPQNPYDVYRTDLKGTRVCFISYNEFNASYQVERLSESLKEMKSTCDLSIVFAHWGVEYQTFSGKKYEDLAHLFIDSGADAVIGGHPHVVQQSEIYKGKHIYYSLGNLVMDQYFEEQVRKGLILILTYNPNNKTFVTREVPVYLDYSGKTILLKP